MYQVIIQEEANDDMINAYGWYEEQRVGLGEEMLSEIDQSLQKLAQHPQHYSYFNSYYRRIKINRFPYCFLYEIRDTLVIVFQFYHTKQQRNLP